MSHSHLLHVTMDSQRSIEDLELALRIQTRMATEARKDLSTQKLLKEKLVLYRKMVKAIDKVWFNQKYSRSYAEGDFGLKDIKHMRAIEEKLKKLGEEVFESS